MSGLLLVLMVMLVRWVWWNQLRGVHLEASDAGLRQTNGGRRATRIAWHEARAFYQIEERDDILPSLRGNRLRIVYALDSGEHMIVWALPAYPRPEMLAAHERLCGLIAARTRLPLRDLTDQVEQRAAARQASHKAARRPVGSDIAPTGTPARPRLTRKQLAAFAAPALVVVLLFAAGGGAQFYQTQRDRQYAAWALARIHAEQPLYVDALRADDGQWPVHPASDTTAGYAFADGSYQVTGGWATLPYTYGDVAVEVTARQLGNADPSFGVGLILRESGDGTAWVTFDVDRLGWWTVQRYLGTRPEAAARHTEVNQSGAVQREIGAANRLLVIMRGSQYFCYVNDQFVGVVWDDALRAGQVGVSSKDDRTVGAFTDFAVYPAP